MDTTFSLKLVPTNLYGKKTQLLLPGGLPYGLLVKESPLSPFTEAQGVEKEEHELQRQVLWETSSDSCTCYSV